MGFGPRRRRESFRPAVRSAPQRARGHPVEIVPSAAHRRARLRQQPETIETVVADADLSEPSNEEEWLKRRRQIEI
jgi:hypothetical protein